MHVRALVTLVALATFALPSVAEACACCDGFSTRRIVGWTAGGAALVEFTGSLACEPQHAFEVWRVGASRPSGCYDLYSETPSTRVDCGDIGTDMTGRDPRSPAERRAGASTRSAPFTSSVRVVRAQDVRAELSIQGGEWPHQARVSVRVRGADGAFAHVVSYALTLGAPDHDDEGEAGSVANGITAKVFVNPAGDRALVRISGHDSAPGTGAFIDDLLSVRLPAMADAAFVDQTHNVYAIPSLTAPAVEEEGARDTNRRGLRAHRRRQFERARAHFASAITQNPRKPIYRVNLACAYALGGDQDSALALLEQLHAQRADCPRCAAVLVRAGRDDDLRSLRSNARFVTITRAR